MVKEQFIYDIVELSFHIPDGHYCVGSDTPDSIANECQSTSNLTVKITTDFMSDNDLLNLLSDNDLNIFLYKHDYQGIASTIDYALSVCRPIAISRSNMFSHINKITPSICVDDFSLKAHRAERTVDLQEGEPLLFGSNKEHALIWQSEDWQRTTQDQAQNYRHQVANHGHALRLANLDTQTFPVPLGVYYRQERPVFNVMAPLTKTVADLPALFRAKNVWQIKSE